MSSSTRVLAHVRGEVVWDEQNPLTRILLADPLKTLADPFFLLIGGTLIVTLNVQGDKLNLHLTQRSGDMRIHLRRSVARSCPTASMRLSDIHGRFHRPYRVLRHHPSLPRHLPRFVVGNVVRLIVERVADAFVENLFGIFRT